MSRLVTALVLIGMLVSACRGPAGSPDTSADVPDDGGRTEPFVVGEMVKLDLPRARSEVTEADIEEVVRGDRALGLDLLGAVGEDGNLMVSPYSVATALSMLYPGARGETASEIAGVMHLGVDDMTLHEVRNVIDEALSDVEDPGEMDTREPFAIRPANSAWGQGGYPFLNDYLTVLASYYGAGLRLVDFVNDSEAARDAVNDWTEETTEGRIKDMLPPGAVNAATRLVLVNAIWFKANWRDAFNPEATSPGPFTKPDGTKSQVPMMHGVFSTGYADTDLFTAVRLPYAGSAAMVVVLPKTGAPTDLVGVMGPDDLDVTWSEHLVDLTMPSFTFESDVPLNETLAALGMPTSFTPPTGTGEGADFTGITAVRELFLSRALHKTYVAVDEDGTEAAAATALTMEATSARPPLPQATMVVDRPFLFWIEDGHTGEPLFLGQVTDPLSS